ncbi:blue copper protein-like [Ananas comosus]|uniref:Blue copper protein-like n=1 Tax=Ananas comosus TaxID=4615 RepID=A0A6P5F417_ANACO|nr:blue copper protein-like [Ananas comosus]
MALRTGVGIVGVAIFLVVVLNISEGSLAARFIVGDSARWSFGYNYTDWAINNAPFFQYDTLVFKYDPPNSTTFPHSVYLMKNLRSFLICDLSKAILVGNVTQGDGQGFEFLLKKRKTHYFACGESNGTHCKIGLMKFSVLPKRPCEA